MNEAELTLARQRASVDGITRLAAWRTSEEAALATREAAQADDARRDYQRERKRLTADFEERHQRLIAEYRAARDAVYGRYEQEGISLWQEASRHERQARERHAESLEAARALRQHRFAEIQRTLREERQLPKRELAQFQRQCEDCLSEVSALTVRAQEVVRRRGAWPAPSDPPPVPAAGLPRQQYVEQYTAALGTAYARLGELIGLKSARFLDDGWPVLVFLALLAAFGYPAWRLVGDQGWVWAIAATVAIAVAVTVAICLVLRPLARRQTLRRVPTFQQAVAQARACLTAALEAAKADTEQKLRQLTERADAEIRAAKDEFKQTRRELKASHETELREAAAKFAARRAAVELAHEAELDDIEASYPRQIEALERDFERQLVAMGDDYRIRLSVAQAQSHEQREQLASRWSAGLAEFEQQVAAMNEYCDARFPSWDSAAAPRPDAGEVAALRFGQFQLDEAADGPLTMPAVLTYPASPSLLLVVGEEGRDDAARALQNAMLRLLTAFPPGKVRFTIIDPVGLGQNFSAFMHLADYDERLVNNRIWTEATHIQQRLADLTEHMENVIQKYLRNEFASIQEYNAHAGEVAEPFQILVVANFPANFSDEAARRLVSIAASGARCGVYTLISVDSRLNLPRNFDLADLEQAAVTLVWDAERRAFRAKDEVLGRLPLVLEKPPPDEQFTSIVRSIGVRAKDAARVEVPFEFVTPKEGQWWTADSRGGIEVPLGRAGAKNLQYLRLGRGTSQHVLIAGKTGSGKSTLLNAMITNLALHYSPQELEFYLIDFKKGVEFKAYAASKLPHARVIAIESEREFGMSVLQRLDDELKRRGDLFRQQGVQDLKGYRTAAPDAVMPRVLLIIDEFQEFFTSDDRIAHDASLLLDRLVRQGRAFGIHVLLGSQTLAGAYSLARSTIGQMAVRIALQCSESDAHLILSEDNTAARLLSRPGEGIYNDANGLFEGNHPFQVVWLSDIERESYLNRLSALASERRVLTPPPIVFEGNTAADPRDNPLLREAIATRATGQSSVAPRAWLGAAVAVKDPTAVTFRRQSGSNLLIVGQQEELALGMLAAALVGLAAQVRPIERPPSSSEPGDYSESRFVVLDGTRPDVADAAVLPSLCKALALDARVVAPREAAKAIQDIAQEVERRLAGGEFNAEPIFLFVYNLARFRDLKKSDDFGMSFGDDGRAGAGKQLATILREGPSLGVHALIWADSYNNVSRWLDRQSLRDFELRVLFQMSATDSSNLMDSPAASRLGPHMALYYSEEQGQAEKVRPYGLPTAEWLESIRKQWAAGPAGASGDDVGSACAVHERTQGD